MNLSMCWRKKSHRVTEDWDIPQQVYIGQWVYEDQDDGKIDPPIIRVRFKILLTEKERQDLVEGINQWYSGLTDELQELKRKKGASKVNNSRALNKAKEKYANAKHAVDIYVGGSLEEVAELNSLVRNEKEKMEKLISESQKELEEIDKEMALDRIRLGRFLGYA